MSLRRHLVRNADGAAVIEMAFALPALIMMVWMFVQLAQMYRAVAGMQQALGEGARYATLCISPTINGCSIPTGDQIAAKVRTSVYGTAPGTFTVTTPTKQLVGTSAYYDLKVSYTQPTDLLLMPGPRINVSRSKRVWVASN